MEFLKHFKPLGNGRRITIGATYNEDGTMSFGVSVCKPGEPFCRKQGRNRAIGRSMSRNKHAGQVNVPAPDRANLSRYFHEIAEAIMVTKNEEINLREEAKLQLAK